MNRRHFFKLAAAMPVVGPAAVKAASVPVDPWAHLDAQIALLGASRPTVFYMNRKVYEMLSKPFEYDITKLTGAMEGKV
jgi:hypothetical protein